MPWAVLVLLVLAAAVFAAPTKLIRRSVWVRAAIVAVALIAAAAAWWAGPPSPPPTMTDAEEFERRRLEAERRRFRDAAQHERDAEAEYRRNLKKSAPARMADAE